MTCVDISAAREAKLTQVGDAKISGVTGSKTVPVFAAKLSILDKYNIDTPNAIGVKIRDQGLIALIGRDVLNISALHCNGPKGMTTWSF